MSEETLPKVSQPEDESTDKSTDEQNGGEPKAEELSLAALNKELGKEFKDVKTALKSLKDTQSYVGKKMEKTKDPTTEEKLANLEKNLTISDFYRNNPQYDNEEARNLIKDLGGDPNEVVEKDSFKKVFEKVSAYEELQNSKSVLHNSSRLGQATTKIGEASDALAKANTEAIAGNINQAKAAQLDAENKAIDSVIESFK